MRQRPHYGDSMVSSFFSVDPQRGQWIAIEPTAGGWGARVDGDGESALINLVNGSFRNISAEVYETKFPIRVEEFALRQDSGGAGKWRGGCGVIRRFRLLERCFGALWFDRSKTTAWGLAGGSAGAGPVNTITLPDGTQEHPLKCGPANYQPGPSSTPGRAAVADTENQTGALSSKCCATSVKGWFLLKLPVRSMAS